MRHKNPQDTNVRHKQFILCLSWGYTIDTGVPTSPYQKSLGDPRFTHQKWAVNVSSVSPCTSWWPSLGFVLLSLPPSLSPQSSPARETALPISWCSMLRDVYRDVKSLLRYCLPAQCHQSQVEHPLATTSFSIPAVHCNLNTVLFHTLSISSVTVPATWCSPQKASGTFKLSSPEILGLRGWLVGQLSALPDQTCSDQETPVDQQS